MTKTKKAIKEVNQMADKAIFKAQYEASKAKTKEWLAVEVHGYKRSTILVSAIVLIAAILIAS